MEFVRIGPELPASGEPVIALEAERMWIQTGQRELSKRADWTRGEFFSTGKTTRAKYGEPVIHELARVARVDRSDPAGVLAGGPRIPLQPWRYHAEAWVWLDMPRETSALAMTLQIVGRRGQLAEQAVDAFEVSGRGPHWRVGVVFDAREIIDDFEMRVIWHGVGRIAFFRSLCHRIRR